MESVLKTIFHITKSEIRICFLKCSNQSLSNLPFFILASIVLLEKWIDVFIFYFFWMDSVAKLGFKRTYTASTELKDVQL